MQAAWADGRSIRPLRNMAMNAHKLIVIPFDTQKPIKLQPVSIEGEEYGHEVTFRVVSECDTSSLIWDAHRKQWVNQDGYRYKEV